MHKLQVKMTAYKWYVSIQYTFSTSCLLLSTLSCNFLSCSGFSAGSALLFVSLDIASFSSLQAAWYAFFAASTQKVDLIYLHLGQFIQQPSTESFSLIIMLQCLSVRFCLRMFSLFFWDIFVFNLGQGTNSTQEST